MELLFWVLVIIGVVSGVPFAVGFGVGQAVERRRWRRRGASEPPAPPPVTPQPPARPHYEWQQPQPQVPPQPQPPSPPPTHPGQPVAAYSYVPQPAPQKSAEEIAAEKKRRERRNINVALYIGGLMLVAAALAFIAVVGDPVLTAVSLSGVCAAFTAGGFITARLSAVLRPAGIALYGTGLALLPVLGIPVNEAIIGDGLLSWLIISVVGTAVYMHGAVSLGSRILGYLVIPFLYSTVFAATAVLRPAIFWALLMVIGVSVLMQVLTTVWGNRLPPVLTRPFGQLHVAVVPGVLVAAVMLTDALESHEFGALFATAAVYYLVSSLHAAEDRIRMVQRVAARPLWLLASAALLSGAGVGAPAFHTVQLGWLVVLYLAVSLVPGFTVGRWARQDRRIMLIVVLAASALLQLRIVLPQELGSTEHAWMIIVSVLTVVAAAHSLLATRDTAAGTAALPWQLVLRAAAVIYAVLALPENVWWTLVWVLVWFIAEWKLSEAPHRGLWQRGAGLAAAGAAGLSLGVLLDDPLLGGRSGLAGLLVVAAAYALVQLIRSWSDPQLRRVVEAWGWAALLIPLTALGTEVFEIQGISGVPYLAGVVVLLYAVVLLSPVLPPQARQQGADLRIVRAGGFAGSLVTAALLVDWEAGLVPEAGLLLAGALMLLSAETAAAIRLNLQRRGPEAAARNWIPLHLSGNMLWLAAVNGVLAATGADGSLYWVTALPWTVSAAVLLWRMDLRAFRSALVVPALYAGASGMLMVFGLSAQDRPWWAAVVLAAAGAVLVLLCLRQLAAPVAALTLPLCAAMGGALLSLGILELADVGEAAAVYLASAGAFTAAAIATLGMRMPRAAGTRQLLVAAAAGLALGASLVPLMAAPAPDPARLGWLLPAMHALLVVAGLWAPVHRRRIVTAFAGSLGLPVSLLFAWSQHYEFTPVTLAAALLLMLAGLLLSEVLLSRRTEGSHLFLGTAAALTGSLVLLSRGGSAPAGGAELFLQATPLAAGTALALFGMLRGHRIALWAGALLPVLGPVPEALPELVWLLPLLHGAVFLVELRRSGAAHRAQCCLFASTGLPVSGLYTWARLHEFTQVSLSLTLLVILAGLMISEFVLAVREELPGDVEQTGRTAGLPRSLFFGAGGAGGHGRGPGLLPRRLRLLGDGAVGGRCRPAGVRPAALGPDGRLVGGRADRAVRALVAARLHGPAAGHPRGADHRGRGLAADRDQQAGRHLRRVMPRSFSRRSATARSAPLVVGR